MPTDLPTWPDKDPADIADYTLAFTDLFPASDPITGAAAAVVPAGLTIEGQAISDRSVALTLSGGLPGSTYRITITAFTATRTFERSVILPVREM
jgi:hypothetical protein